MHTSSLADLIYTCSFSKLELQYHMNTTTIGSTSLQDKDTNKSKLLLLRLQTLTAIRAILNNEAAIVVISSFSLFCCNVSLNKFWYLLSFYLSFTATQPDMTELLLFHDMQKQVTQPETKSILPFSYSPKTNAAPLTIESLKNMKPAAASVYCFLH